MNAHAERIIRTIKEHLHPLEFGELQFRRKMRAFEKFYNTERHHQGIEGKIPIPKHDAFHDKGRVTRAARLNGRQSYYFRKAS
jgi:hypothetical protein